jgi:PPOX class probable F420-dependent enzyme
MPDTLSPNAAALFAEPNLAHLATLMPDGSPQVTPVWVDYDGRHILVNTALGRAKAHNLARDPRVALSLVDRAHTNRMVAVRGVVVEITEDGADAHIDKLSKKYTGADTYRGRAANPAERRVILRIEPRRVIERGLA